MDIGPVESVRFKPRDTAPDFVAMHDGDLVDAIEGLSEDIAVITDQISDDLSGVTDREDGWRGAAAAARNFKRAHLRFAQQEVRRREDEDRAAAEAERARLAAEVKRQHAADALATEKVKLEAAKQARQAVHEALLAKQEEARQAKAVAVEQQKAAWERRQARKARMFLAAIRKEMPKEEIGRLWRVAEAMFPDAPEWVGLPPVGSTSATTEGA